LDSDAATDDDAGDAVGADDDLTFRLIVRRCNNAEPSVVVLHGTVRTPDDDGNAGLETPRPVVSSPIP
jgi:hypothetical protein